MIRMLCRFDLAPGVTLDALDAAYGRFVDEMKTADLVVGSDPIGHRVDDTPMDTDEAASQRLFVIMTFRDRAQLDASYAQVAARKIAPAAHGDHEDFKSSIINEVFTCWEPGA